MKRPMTYESKRMKEKIKFQETIFHGNSDEPFKWKDIKHIEFQDDDELCIRYEEGFYSENNSWDGGFVAEVFRMQLESDEEFNNRMIELEKDKEFWKKKRYENYLKLKEEFEK
jgi:hypothetical protein